MMCIKKIVSILFIVLSFSVFAFGQTAKLKIKDVQNLTGAQWTGTLTYLDYGRNTKVAIPSNLTVTRSKDNKSSLIFEYQYPDEPKANSKKTVEISNDGKTFGDETVIKKTALAGETLKIITQKDGTDNNKKALFRFTYLLGKNSLSVKKEVRYDGTSEFFLRNEYIWKR